MSGHFSEVLLYKFKELLLGIQEEISREEQARDLEELNGILEKINMCSTHDLQTKRKDIESRIMERSRRSRAGDLSRSLTPEVKEDLGSAIETYMKKHKNK